MKKILVFTLLSVFFVMSPLAAVICPSCQPVVTYLNGPRPACTPCAAPVPVQPVVVESAAMVKSVNSRIITVVSPEHFEALIRSGNVIVKFGASWCNPCEQLTIELEKIAENYSAVKVIYVDTDVQKTITYQNNISSLPTMQFYKNGVQVSAPVMGRKTQAEVRNMIKNNFGL
jgi:thioredoxin 1